MHQRPDECADRIAGDHHQYFVFGCVGSSGIGDLDYCRFCGGVNDADRGDDEGFRGSDGSGCAEGAMRTLGAEARCTRDRGRAGESGLSPSCGTPGEIFAPELLEI